MSGFTKEELMHYKSVLHSNVLVGMATLIEMAPKLGYTIDPALEVLSHTSFYSFSFVSSSSIFV